MMQKCEYCQEVSLWPTTYKVCNILTQSTKREYNAAKIKITATTAIFLAFYKNPFIGQKCSPPTILVQKFKSEWPAELLMVNVLYALMRFP